MRKILITLCLLQAGLLFGQNKDAVLFSVGDDKVHLSEFKYIYEKNNADKADYSKESIDEYLELYKKFKLKVHRARQQGLDTIKTLQKELEGYRKQLAATYLKDKEIAERLIEEVVDRYAEDREVSHIFVECGPNSTVQQGEIAKQKITDVYNKLNENKGAAFGMMAQTLSHDKVSAKNKGRLGYYTAPLPDGFYEFENAMYNTKEGEYSEPFQTKMGYHIVKVTDVRPARGEMEIAHILVRKTKKAKVVENAKARIDSVYQQLNSGRNFESLASKYSDDNKTRQKGGYLGFFGVNQYEIAFEDAAFALTDDNTYTKPIETSVGYHIIKRISKRDNKDKKRTKKRIESRINNNDRFKIAEQKLIEDVKAEAQFSENRSLLIPLYNKLDDSFYSYKWEPQNYGSMDKVLFSLAKKDYTLNDFVTYMKTNVRERLKFSKTKPLAEAASILYDAYVKEQVMSYEESNLENKYPDFKALMREYREGILLFEITKNEVWDKASQDSVGLKAFYDKNASKYMWPERVKTKKVEIDAKSKMALEEAYTYAKKKGMDKFLEKYSTKENIKLKVTEEILEAAAPEISAMDNKPGKVSAITKQYDKKGHFYGYVSSLPPGQKTLKEARGYVIADYQDHLEKAWVEQLKKDHAIKVDEKVLKSLIR